MLELTTPSHRSKIISQASDTTICPLGTHLHARQRLRGTGFNEGFWGITPTGDMGRSRTNDAGIKW